MSDVSVVDNLSRLTRRAKTLHDSFDRAFAEPARLDITPMQDLLAIRIGEDVFAIRLSEIAGLYASKKITRLPGGDPALLGLAGFRGTMHPVYSLATLLGRSAEASPRWLVIAAAVPLALAFDGFERHLRVALATIRPSDASMKDQPFARDFVPVQQFVRPILHLPSILDVIGARQAAATPGENR
jgi:chemotaxis signal transduction protein